MRNLQDKIRPAGPWSRCGVVKHVVHVGDETEMVCGEDDADDDGGEF
jgi:hypothetical protein